MMMVGGILEFFIGNTFPCVVFMSLGMLSRYPRRLIPNRLSADWNFLGALFFSLGATNIPAFGVMQSFVTAEYTSGAQNPVFYSSFGQSQNPPPPGARLSYLPVVTNIKQLSSSHASGSSSSSSWWPRSARTSCS
jgi:hypothetical protein